ncbi:hypothetical protein GUJ93_ZPchr0008g13351 [Zizania palustris]|uniref:Uncharacterized protein n=1 Tax=Zizania palustris TaxID=103762 RepID=A0A8J5RGQ3_ZIZPA|nr:hypothetical protein GUJ93_ZPchr0008g13351 [Zizania palustris]
MARAATVSALVAASALLAALLLALGGGAGAAATGKVPLSWELGLIGGAAGISDGDDDVFGFSADSAAAVVRRVLQEKKYISYGAMNAGTTPCSIPGASYYNCRPGAEANPYTRGCSAITQCTS